MGNINRTKSKINQARRAKMIKKKPAPEFLVVYEDEWNNKESYRTKQIGTTIEQICKDFAIIVDYDKSKYNSKDPYDRGTFGPGFYDLDCTRTADGDGILEDEHAGRIMIFGL
jgi:hypothetical protein